ncbi:MAG: trimethylamine corrinoid protein 2 [bacterium]|nr:trimethylamine corrinoid protein 2 [bacterium]
MSSRPIMPIDRIPDWEQRMARQDAFWDCAIIDRPVVLMGLLKQNPECQPPEPRTYESERERWMDTDRVVAEAVAQAKLLEYLGDALPVAWPNLGPEVFSAFFGIDMEYTEDTSWAVPVITDWSDPSALQFSEDNFYWKKLVEMTDALLEAGKGLFYVGISDIHPGGDALAAFREPIELNTDLLISPGPVRDLLNRVNAVYADVYDTFYAKLSGAGQAITSWPCIVSSRKWYVPSNDFSCMISNEMFEDFFLPGIEQECRQLEASIYHLDGPDALRHLDSLLDIKDLNAIQWVYGAGNGRASDWTDVYKRCQAAGKGIQLTVDMDELDWLFSELKPEGAWLHVTAEDRDQVDLALRRVEKWA